MTSPTGPGFDDPPAMLHAPPGEEAALAPDATHPKPRSPQGRYRLNLEGPSTAHALVLRLVGRDKSVLEVGPATGYLSRYLVEAGCRVTGVEVDAESARWAEQQGVRLLRGSIEDEEVLRQIRATFDVVVLADILEHLRWPERTLLRMEEFLTPGGYAVISLPNIANWKTRIGLLLGRFDYQDEGILDRTHLRFFTKRSAEAMIRGAGFEVLEFHPGATRMPAILLKAWPTLCAVHLVFKVVPRKERR